MAASIPVPPMSVGWLDPQLGLAAAAGGDEGEQGGEDGESERVVGELGLVG